LGCEILPQISTGTATTYHSAYSTTSSTLSSIDWRSSQWYLGDITVQPVELPVGQTAVIEANIYVPGIVERNGNAYLSVDGQIVDSIRDILIYGDEIIPVNFTFTPQQPGNYKIRIGVILQDNEPYSPGDRDLVAFLNAV
jgi:hypothetical protein